MRPWTSLVLSLILAGCGSSSSHTGDSTSAASDYDESIRRNPKDPVAYNGRGLERQSKGDLNGAIMDYYEAIRLDEKYSAAWFNRGTARKASGDVAGAIKDFSEAIRLDPKNSMSYIRRGNARSEKGDLDEAIKDYNEAIRLDPKSSLAFNNRAIAHVAKGDTDGAIKSCDEAIRQDSNNLPAFTLRATLRFDRGLLRDALSDCMRSVKALPHGDAKADYPAILALVCRARLSEPRRSAPELDAVFADRDGKSTEDWPATVAAFLRGGITEEQFLLSKDSGNETRTAERSCEAWFYAGEIRLSDGDTANAKLYFEKCLATKVSKFTEFVHARAELSRMAAKK